MPAAQMHGWIMSFLEGNEVRVGEAGVRGNEGEKQQVAIARAMVNNSGCCFWMRRRVRWILRWGGGVGGCAWEACGWEELFEYGASVENDPGC
jgi:hypothetical protein